MAKKKIKVKKKRVPASEELLDSTSRIASPFSANEVEGKFALDPDIRFAAPARLPIKVKRSEGLEGEALGEGGRPRLADIDEGLLGSLAEASLQGEGEELADELAAENNRKRRPKRKVRKKKK